MDSKCKQWDEYGLLYAYEELTAELAKIFKGHLEGCPYCQNEFKQLKVMQPDFSLLKERRPSPQAEDKVYLFAKQRLFKPSAFKRWVYNLQKTLNKSMGPLRFPLLQPALAVAVVVLILFLTIFKASPPGNNTVLLVKKASAEQINAREEWDTLEYPGLEELSTDIELIQAQITNGQYLQFFETEYEMINDDIDLLSADLDTV